MMLRGGNPGIQDGMRRCRRADQSAGVSEVIGSVLLLALVVAGAGIVAVVLFSQQTPTKIPNVDFMVGRDTSGANLYLYHNGGDSLRNGEFSVLVDGVSKPYTIVGGTDNWSLGKNLQVSISLPPQRVQLVYNSTGSGGVVISSALINVSTTPGYVAADISQSVPVTDYCPACDLNTIPARVAGAYMNNLTGNYILFGRSTLSDIPASPGGGYFNFTVTDPGLSSIQISGAVAAFPYPLTTGDKVSLAQAAATGYKIFSIGNEIWELWATNANVIITHSNGTVRTYNGRTVYNAMISGCTIDSTLDITRTAAGATNVLLVMNDTIKRNQNTGEWVIITNIRPTKAGLFSLVHDANSNVYFVGNADSVTIDGVPQV
jgi:hypothetical protein